MTIQNKSLFSIEPTFTVDSYYSSYTYTSVKAAAIPVDNIYIVTKTTDIIKEDINQGIDTVNSSITYSLVANIENLTLTGKLAINGTGNSLDNIIIGNTANNKLYGGLGNDTIDAGQGNNFVYGEAGNDSIMGGLGYFNYYDGGSGTDTVDYSKNSGALAILLSANRVWGSYTSGGAAYTNYKGSKTDWHRYDQFVGIENIIGSKNADSITGNSGINMLDGGAGDDKLFGMAGADILLGGLGNDLIDGGSDVDSMTGGLGNDTYIVDNVNDSVVENLDQGVDTVNSSVSYTLKDNFENLLLIGNLSINGFGNSENNVIKGNSASNIIDGGTGNDTIYGGLGDDLFIGHAGFSTFFDGGDGLDTVDYSDSSVGISSKLTADVINWGLSSSGGGAFKDSGTDSPERDDFVGIENIIGSSFDDIIVGNDGANIFAGGLGSDYLTGASGSDVFIFNSSLGTDNIDIISDFKYSEGDRIYLDHKIFTKLEGITDLSNYFVNNGRMNGNSFLLYSPESGHLSYDSDGTGPANLQEFLYFTSGLTDISASSFVVI